MFSKKANSQNKKEAESAITFVKEELTSSYAATKSATVSEHSNELSVIPEKMVPQQKIISDTVRTKVKESSAAPDPIAQQNINQIEKIPAEYPGGMQQLRSEVSKTFNTAVLNGNEGLLKTTVYFNIDETGRVASISSKGDNSTFNQEAERAFTVVNGGKNWKPATDDGIAVKAVYRLPLSMVFEGVVSKK